ncbi:hypothetical protein OGH69_11370 [Flavobacterium sp. MFBS3-15]|uniref:EpsG family protein n=1 Tax=Flavobacterium sp. MFBS3-15 TaxID=2989816 RepID=UPI0022360EB8|nr:EpsG family protein [Flavobacterium sp. MFBS3-15]MCW4469568.1 hypothetical protein [Flavobacterium sp. MFBS3-15]
MRQENNRHNVPYLLTMVAISPAISLFYLISNFDWKVKKPFFIFLTVLFGATILLSSSDGAVLKELVYIHYINLPFNQWLDELIQILQFKQPYGTKGDVFNHLVSYISGTLLMLPETYFYLVSFVYAYFFVNSLEKILNRPTIGHKGILFWLIIIIFVTYRFVDNLQSVRTWTGLWVLFYGTYCFYTTGKKKYLLIMLMAPLFHIAYFIMALPVYLSIILKKVDFRILVIFYIMSFFITINHEAIVKQLGSTDIGANKIDAYYDEDGGTDISQRRVSGTFYAVYGRSWSQIQSPHILIFALILSGFITRKRLTAIEYGLFCSALLLSITANLVSFIGAFYVRTMTNAGIYVTAATALLAMRGAFDIKSTGHLNLFQKTALWIALLTFIPYIIYVVANMFQFTSAYMIVFPIGGFFGDNISIGQLLKQFF